MEKALTIYLFIFILGACIGSFLCCLSYRIINKLPFINDRSRCDYCGSLLKTSDLIPLISYLLNKGKCKYCGHKISLKYPLSELLIGVISILIYYKFGFSLYFVLYLVLMCLLFVISYIDYETYYIFDSFLIMLLLIGITLLLIKGNLINGLINGLVLSLMIWLVRLVLNKALKAETMGLGDIKLLFVLGILNSFYLNIIGLFISCFLALIFSTLYKKKIIPFGPFICAGYFIVIVYGDLIINLANNL